MKPDELVGKIVQAVLYPRDAGPMVILFTDGTTLHLENGFGMSPNAYTATGEELEYNL